MADKKISQLAAATTPLTGAELLPIVQSGNTVSATVSNVLAAPNSSGTANGIVYLDANKVNTSGTGLQFNGANVGIGTAPFAWKATNYTAADIGAAGGIYYDAPGSAFNIANNTYINNTNYLYKTNTFATRYDTYRGQHRFFTAPSGTAGNTISFIQVLTVFNTGGISIGDTTDPSAGNLRLGTGNLTLGTAAKGINFSANTPSAGMTSQLLNWYEEGAWTPNQGAGLTLVGAFSSFGTYTRIGRQVTVRGQVVGATSVAVTAAGVMSSNLPFAASVSHAGSMFNSTVNASGVVQITASSVVAATTMAATPNITFTATYTV